MGYIAIIEKYLRPRFFFREGRKSVINLRKEEIRQTNKQKKRKWQSGDER